VLLSHNGFDVDRKLASVVNGIDVILTGHTHDAMPHAIEIVNDAAAVVGFARQVSRPHRSGSEGRQGGGAFSSNLIPVFSDVITPDAEMAAKIDEVRAPYEARCNA
jgi:sulfur-oxidizing protein SoxB